MHFSMRHSSLFVLVSLSFLLESSTAADTITRNQSITQRETIISAGGIFELGFFSPKNSSNIYLGIWYKKVSAQTVVWVSNGDYPILGSSASLTINLAGDIMISDGRLFYMVSNTSSSNNTYATLLDSGNLILRDRNSLEVLWQSFDYPTDTLLPGIKLRYDVGTGFSWYLRSWRSAQDPDLGVFSLQSDSKGEKLIIKQGSIIYWTGAATHFQLSGASTWNWTNWNWTKEFGYVTWSGDRNNSIISQRVLDVSGQLKLQSWTESSQQWYSLEASKCGNGISGCGAFSICNESAQIPCDCLPGFKPKFEDSWTQEPEDTWTEDLTAKGCVRKTTLNCSNSNDSLSEKDGFFSIGNLLNNGNNHKQT